MGNKTSVSKFRSLYTYINEETLQQAVSEGNYSLLLGMLKEDINDLTVSCILIALGESMNPKFEELLWGYTKNPVALIRESAFMGLICYPDEERPHYNFFLDKFKESLKVESSEGVIKRLNLCIDVMENRI